MNNSKHRGRDAAWKKKKKKKKKRRRKKEGKKERRLPWTSTGQDLAGIIRAKGETHKYTR